MVSVRVFLILFVAAGLALLAMPVSARNAVPPGLVKKHKIEGTNAKFDGKFLDVNKKTVVDLYNWQELLVKNERSRQQTQ